MLSLYYAEAPLLAMSPKRYRLHVRFSRRRKGTIRCMVTASCRFSGDLPQRGLEVPCMLIFRGEPKDVVKIKKLVVPVCVKQTTVSGAENEPPNKVRKINSVVIEVDQGCILLLPPLETQVPPIENLQIEV